MRGKLISFEGLDGSGKTTQIKKLSAYLESKQFNVVETFEPGDNTSGAILRDLILNPSKNIAPAAELFLYLADRAQHTAEIIMPALTEGKVVISDRFADATLAYQGYGRGIDIPLIKSMNNFATSDIKPDLTVLLDISPIDGQTRMAGRQNEEYENGDRIEKEKIEFHQKLYNGYHTIAASDPTRFIIIDAMLTEEEIHEQIKQKIDKLFSL